MTTQLTRAMTGKTAMPPRRAFLDANVLRGHLQTDVLLTLADLGAFQPRWSAEVLDEVRRNRPPRLSEQAIDRRLNQMNRAFPQAMVTGYEHLEPEMQADAKDRHVLAAAVQSTSTVLVTENVKDFRPPTTGPHAMPVEKTSRFLNRLLEDNHQLVIVAMNEMISRTDREPNTMSALIDKLASRHDLRSFAQNLNSVVEPEHRGTHPGLARGRTAKSAHSVAFDEVAPPTGAAHAPTESPEARTSQAENQDKDRGSDREA
ncbi:PIN domain-containing protein [Kribbella sp. NPDC049174]|uniref:PIN domain-containing protein n=1 Tax=Kribbella sp. NPDC049174 TaxID=3364112 RepID=UPI0037218273